MEARREDLSSVLLRHAAYGAAGGFRCAPGFETLSAPGAACILTGEAAPTYNLIYLGPDCDPDAALRTFIARARERRVQLYVLASESLGEALDRVVRELELPEDAHRYPLMTSTPPAMPEEVPGWTIIRATTENVAACRSLMQRATGLAPEICRRVLADESLGSGVVFGEEVEVDYYWTFRDDHPDEPLSALRTTRRAGDGVVGIWSMATPPEHQRKGAGRALLAGMMREQMQRGASRFFLCSTPAGRRLYDLAGFRVVDPWRSWSDGMSAEELAEAY